MMNWVVGILSLLGIVFIGYVVNEWLLKKLPAKQEKLPYKLNPHFFTQSEFAFYQELKKQVGDRYEIFPKVRLADLIDVDIDKYKNRSEWQTYWNKIRSKHVDFLLCDPETLKPMVAVELNGKSHQTKKMRERDEFVSKIYESVNLKFVTNQVGSNFITTIHGILQDS